MQACVIDNYGKRCGCVRKDDTHRESSIAPAPTPIRLQQPRRSTGEPYPFQVLLRWCPEEPAVLATELRGTLVANKASSVTRVNILVQHQLPRFLKSQLLLVLQRARAGDRAEMLAECTRTHVYARSQIVNLDRTGEILLEPCDGFGNLLTGRPVRSEVLKLRTVWSR
jgi:hypothetical protein